MRIEKCKEGWKVDGWFHGRTYPKVEEDRRDWRALIHSEDYYYGSLHGRIILKNGCGIYQQNMGVSHGHQRDLVGSLYTTKNGTVSGIYYFAL
jgi:hypothetical protein